MPSRPSLFPITRRRSLISSPTSSARTDWVPQHHPAVAAPLPPAGSISRAATFPPAKLQRHAAPPPLSPHGPPPASPPAPGARCRRAKSRISLYAGAGQSDSGSDLGRMLFARRRLRQDRGAGMRGPGSCRGVLCACRCAGSTMLMRVARQMPSRRAGIFASLSRRALAALPRRSHALDLAQHILFMRQEPACGARARRSRLSS